MGDSGRDGLGRKPLGGRGRKNTVAWTVIALVRALSWLPLSWARALGAGIGRLGWWLRLPAASVTEANLALSFPELDEHARRDLGRRSLMETCRLACESGFIWHADEGAFADALTVVAGDELLEAARSHPGGTLLLVPHWGNWEVLAFALGPRMPITFLYDPPKIPALEASIIRARTRWGLSLARLGVGGLRQVRRALAAGEAVGVLPDQTPRPDAAVHAPFFGVDVLTMTLARRLIGPETQVLMVTVGRSRSGFELTCERVDDAIRDDDPVVSATVMNAAVERAVRRDLAQYQWEYKRFRPRRRRGGAKPR